MKRLIAVFLLALTICALSVGAVFAATPSRLVDGADILTYPEESGLLLLLNEVSEKYDLDVVVVTVNSLGGKSPRAFADDYYDDNGYRADGILLLVAMDSRDYWVSTSGYGIRAFTDEGIDYISNRFEGDLRDGNYASAFTIYAELCDEFISKAKSGKPYDDGHMPRGDFPLGQNLLISLLVGFVIAFIATAVMRARLKSVRSKSDAADYVKQGSFRVTNASDVYLYRRVTKRARPKDNGGSSTHRSSSGRSHGGGGGKF
jgi:uncharacterized protein